MQSFRSSHRDNFRIYLLFSSRSTFSELFQQAYVFRRLFSSSNRQVFPKKGIFVGNRHTFHRTYYNCPGTGHLFEQIFPQQVSVTINQSTDLSIFKTISLVKMMMEQRFFKRFIIETLLRPFYFLRISRSCTERLL